MFVFLATVDCQSFTAASGSAANLMCRLDGDRVYRYAGIDYFASPKTRHDNVSSREAIELSGRPCPLLPARIEQSDDPASLRVDARKIGPLETVVMKTGKRQIPS